MMVGVPAATVVTSIVRAAPAAANHDTPGDHFECHTHTSYWGYQERSRWYQYGYEWWQYVEHLDWWYNETWCNEVLDRSFWTNSGWYGWEWRGPY